MARVDRINRIRAKAHQQMAGDKPGLIAFSEDDPDATPLPCALRIGMDSREATDGGFSRIRTATVLVAKSDLPTLPDLETRPVVELTPLGRPTEKFRVMEAHDQSLDYWFIRCAQWG